LGLNSPVAAHLNLLGPNVAVKIATCEVFHQNWAVFVVDHSTETAPDEQACKTYTDKQTDEGDN
jgi:hypothetical protein